MKENQMLGPQNTFVFRVIAFFSKLQLSYLLRSMASPRFVVVLFVFIAGATAMGIITLVAYLTKLPLLFPPLGPSAFILFHTPMSVTASPRNVILSHTLAVAAGLLSFQLVGMICPGSNLIDSSVMNWYRVMAIALSMGLIGILMISVRCVHPPAAASALIAAMGYLANPEQILGIIGAVILLVLEAIETTFWQQLAAKIFQRR
ncbi:MAG: HPP family protein [Deltaproteobacteria bacterium]|nr:HPP family protein [Deltaproteobacteria bacterium]